MCMSHLMLVMCIFILSASLLLCRGQRPSFSCCLSWVFLFLAVCWSTLTVRYTWCTPTHYICLSSKAILLTFFFFHFTIHSYTIQSVVKNHRGHISGHAPLLIPYSKHKKLFCKCKLKLKSCIAVFCGIQSYTCRPSYKLLLTHCFLIDLHMRGQWIFNISRWNNSFDNRS